MHTVEPLEERVDRDIVSEFEGIPSSIVSDVTGNVGFAMDSGIKPIYEGAEMAGSAVTVKAAPGDNLIIHKAITMAKPGDVLVIDANGYLETGHLGELMCASCKAQGLAGIVIDGAIRDRRDIEEMEFPVYARGVHPQGPLKQDPGSINVTVSCGDVSIKPGDIVVGDDEGVTAVPADSAERVLEDSKEKLTAESDLRERAEAGEYLFEISGYNELYEEMDVVGPEDSVQ
ncbi:4-carboxy-4-hydroxy-2-oxoadipate aldolase/oxaloacetate decarboxylase [Natrinema versiforme]|uniref:4-carboxy-4-hydroxy-2-oxoadipate aldolase/oxaloacetate decarboxylase n=1 Tax=Natrinema versiforme TaxID=88724 RepID=A0A4P8WNL0_9EURY|nr:4-carboxy-4-hydroxy-2-oxoadipate aldolase/oxaloacetate decarboxylase [Natrinema versiforme]QCS44965.1 4-carboxy-4-hydroxy-2-oxoadipate aldolase/oxaloacetate decarboxylase [Natrinema versiforme]